jgi:hypothetical protein
MRVRSMVIVSVTVWLSGLALAALAMRGAMTAPLAPPQTLTARIPAAGLSALAIAGTDGRIELEALGAGAAQVVEVTVEVSAASPRGRWPGRTPGNPAVAALESDATAGVLTLRLLDKGTGALEERWSIKAPAALLARLSLERGRIDVTGMAGGVIASARSGLGAEPGEIRVEVPRGLLTLALGVGTIRASTMAATYGEVVVQSAVGDASLAVDGHDVVSPRAPGPGHRLHLGAPGHPADALAIRVEVGDAMLRIR